jgi:hypothetical protein
MHLVATAGMTASVPRDPIQTLVLKVEKEREDALAQAKQLAEENTQLHRVRTHLQRTEPQSVLEHIRSISLAGTLLA